MTIIAVDGVPNRMKMKDLVKTLASTVGAYYEGINFVPLNKIEKTAYLRLSDRVDPMQVIQKLNGRRLKTSHLRAYITDKLPDKMSVPMKPKAIPVKTRRALRIPPPLSAEQLVMCSLDLLMTEMQTKYTGLYRLSQGTGHRLINTIGKTVYDRLSKICSNNNDLDACFKLTKVYRKRHPHFGDFQLILSTLHSLQDAAGKPREQILESELTAVAIQSTLIDNMPYDKVQTICKKYIGKITNQVLEHVRGLELRAENPSMQEAARVKVREQLKKLTPYLPTMIQQVIFSHFMPPEKNLHIVKVYGEPFLPGKEIMQPFTKRHRVVSVIRSERMYNYITLQVPQDSHMALLAADGTLIGGAKLVIRPSNLPIYRVSAETVRGASHHEEEPMEEEPMEAEWSESW